MTSYYLARLDIGSAPGLKETVSGLRALVNMTRFDGSGASGICAKIFSREDFGSADVDCRIEVYLLFKVFLEKHEPSLMMMGDEFILGMTTIASKERHPRCLQIVFSNIRAILENWNIKSCVQQLWEYVAQYYPISYYVKPGDSASTALEELKRELRYCIAATPDFAPFAFEFLLGKLDTQVSAEVKVGSHRFVSQVMQTDLK
jgi:DNA repair/transcription protein MET18/MMS19